MNNNYFINLMIAALQHNDRKIALETIKEAIDNNGMSKDYNDIINSYIELGFEFFEEQDTNKAKMECMNLYRLMDKFRGNR